MLFCLYFQGGALRVSPLMERYQMKQYQNLKKTSLSQQKVCALKHTQPCRPTSHARVCTSVMLLSCSSLTEDGYSPRRAKNLLAPEKAARLIELPTGCLEQTMVNLAPTASAIRYLDLSEQWFDLPIGARDDALDKLEKGRTAGGCKDFHKDFLYLTDICF